MPVSSWTRVVVGVTQLAVLILVLACSEEHMDYPREPSWAYEDTADTYFGRALAEEYQAHPGESGFLLLLEGTDALACRIRMAERAERSLDVQYYFILEDGTGYLFAQSLLEAADRGVRVRILLDDISTSEHETGMATLVAHPNIEIRIFNPFSRRRPRFLDFVTDLGRVNHRMHNKSMTADSQATIVGGRNIGDEYFGARADVNFDDLDVIGFGKVARDVSNSFDLYWNSDMAVPVAALLPEDHEPEPLERLRTRWSTRVAEVDQTPYREALDQAVVVAIERQADVLTWSPAQVVSDPPGKVLDDASKSDPGLLRSQLRPAVLAAKKELMVISPYFVPRETGVEGFRKLRDNGLRVIVVTNSLASTDVTAVHAGYARYRKELLEMGVEIWEVRATKTLRELRRLKLGMSRSSLHTKAFVVDREKLFVGSFNWDPRSVEINTEMGVFLDSPELAEWTSDRVEEVLPRVAYLLRLDERGKIEWVWLEDGEQVVYTSEPEAGLAQRLGVNFYTLLPIEGQL